MTTLAKSDFVSPVAVARPRFFVNAAAVCLAVGVIGFAPTYWVPLLTGRLEMAPLAHLHALAFYGWLILFLRQAQLAASREIGRHRALGVAGVALGTAMCFLGFGMATLSVRQGEAAGFGEDARAFAIVPFTAIMLFAALFVVALRYIARPEIHKRLMFVNTAQMLQAAVGRWFLLAFAPALPSATTVFQPPPVAVTIGPALVVDLLIVWGMVHDRRTRGRVHPAYWIAGGAVLAVQLLRVPVSLTPQWQAVTHGLLAFAP